MEGMMKKLLRKASGVAVSAISTGVVMALLWPSTVGATAGSDVHLPAPGPALEQLHDDAPYEPKKPRYLPQGMKLFLVNWTEPTGDDSAFSVDLYYSAPDGRRLHIWQTNDPTITFSEKDPVKEGDPEVIDGEIWTSLELPDFDLNVLNHRFNDQITISFDGNINWSEMREVAKSFLDD
jgi:hypothetical protein